MNVCMHALCPRKPEEGFRSPKSGATESCETALAYWEWNPGPGLCFELLQLVLSASSCVIKSDFYLFTFLFPYPACHLL